MLSEGLEALTADLRSLRGQRVWSLMISLFGDLAQGEGDKIDGPVLSAIMAALDVKPEAARVALHRLRNDGWIMSEKSGRISQHSLTKKGRDETVAASPRIYAAPEAVSGNWQLLMFENTEATEGVNLKAFVQISPCIYVGSTAHGTPQGALVLQGSDAPDWLKAQMIPPELVNDYSRLRDSLSKLSNAFPDPKTLRPLDKAVLRCLVVHNWRRLILKHAQPPQALISKEGAAHQCHLIVAKLLCDIPRPSLSEIAQDQAHL